MITFGSYNNFEKTLEEMRDQISNKLEKSKNVIMNDNFHNLCHSYNLYEQESGTVAILELPLPGFYENEITSVLKDRILTITAKKEHQETRVYLVNIFLISDKEIKIKLPQDIADGIWEAELKNGILRYTIQKVAPKDNSTYINFKAK